MHPTPVTKPMPDHNEGWQHARDLKIATVGRVTAPELESNS